MVKRLVEFPLEDGGTMLVEVDDSGPSSGPTLRSARPSEVMEKARLSYEEAIDKIRPAAESIVERLRSIGHAPDEIEVEFGLKLSADAGAFIASVGAEATYTIRLLWRREIDTSEF